MKMIVTFSPFVDQIVLTVLSKYVCSRIVEKSHVRIRSRGHVHAVSQVDQLTTIQNQQSDHAQDHGAALATFRSYLLKYLFPSCILYNCFAMCELDWIVKT